MLCYKMQKVFSTSQMPKDIVEKLGELERFTPFGYSQYTVSKVSILDEWFLAMDCHFFEKILIKDDRRI